MVLSAVSCMKTDPLLRSRRPFTDTELLMASNGIVQLKRTLKTAELQNKKQSWSGRYGSLSLMRAASTFG